MRITPGMFGQQPDDLQELAPARLARCGVADVVHPLRLGQDFAHGLVACNHHDPSRRECVRDEGKRG